MNTEREDSTITISNYSLNSLPKLPNDIKSLVADNNNLTSLMNLPSSLNYLSLSKNKIAFLGNLESEGQHLLHLNLSSNRLISLEGISNCRSLQTLLIANNYVGDDQIVHIQYLKDLKILDISHNHLRDKHFLMILSSLSQIEELLNASNDFSEWKMQAPLKNLKKMVLDSNKIRKIEFCSELSGLKHLSIRENNVSLVVGVRNCLALEELDLSGNDLSELSPDFSQLRSLKKLILKNNSLCSLPKIPNLKYLDVSFNTLLSVSSIPGDIKDLFLSHNSIADLPSLTNIVNCDLSYNKLSILTGLETGSSLETLNISQNLFQSTGAVLKSIKAHKFMKNLNLEGIDLPAEAIDTICTIFPVLETLNNKPLSSFIQTKIRKLSPIKAWDSLSKSKLFPSCRSSLAELDKNIVQSGEFSIFSDIKLESSINSNKPEDFHKDTEYRLLEKELEINDRIKKLDYKTRQFGDSLISNKSPKKTDSKFNDSLISRQDSTKKDSSSFQYLATLPNSSSPYSITDQPSQSYLLNKSSNSNSTSNLTPVNKPVLLKNTEKNEDSTISFDISVSKSKEPRKFISDGTRGGKKAKCCKHCCNRRRKSINLQTSIKGNKDFIDQATSPMHSLMKIPIISTEKTVRSGQNTEKSPSAYSNRSYLTEVPGSSNRNLSFIEENRVLQSRRSNTPLQSYKNLIPKGKSCENLQLINYASTPPRPILASEIKSPILYTLSPNGTEFFLLSQIFACHNKSLKEVIKTYTFYLQKKIQNLRPENFLNKAEKKNCFLFFKAGFADLESICNSPEGFSAVIGGQDEGLEVFMDLKEGLGSREGNAVVVAISNLQGMNCIRNGVFRVDHNSVIVPVYLVEYCN